MEFHSLALLSMVAKKQRRGRKREAEVKEEEVEDEEEEGEQAGNGLFSMPSATESLRPSARQRQEQKEPQCR